MGAGVETWETEQGATFSYGFVVHDPLLDVDGNVVTDADGNALPGDPTPLADVTIARMQIREEKEASSYLVYATSEAFDETTAPHGGRIFLETGAETGRIDIVLTDQDTDQIIVTDAVYDLEIEWAIESGEIRPRVDRILEGPVVNDLNVTR